MRHFEEFELEHLLNSTGGFFFRWRCRKHVKNCPVCSKRMENVLADRNFVSRLKQALSKFNADGLSDGKFS